jgi:hypothetical protein
MGSSGDKPRKPRRHLDKVPKYEEANTLGLPGIGGGDSEGAKYGRFGHGSDHHHPGQPGRVGFFFLRLLGLRSKR